MVLDVGGRYQPYRPLLNGKISNYLALDVERTEFVTVLGSGENIPFRSETFDVVIATQVFEYFRKPHEASNEVYRVLKPGGSLLLSVAAVLPRFRDEELWRFLPLGLRSLFSQFAQLTVTPEVSSLGGFCRLMNLGFRDFLKIPALKSAYDVSICPGINLLGLLLARERSLNLKRQLGW
jgi:SAM-dependent methyltransferase